MNTRTKFLIAAVCLWCFSIFTDFRPYYSKEQIIPVELVQMYSGTSGGKYSRLQFIAVYEDANGRRFDREVSAAFNSQAEVGQKYNLNIRPEVVYDEYRTGWKMIWGLGSGLLYLFSYISAFVFTVIGLLPKRFIDWLNEDWI